MSFRGDGQRRFGHTPPVQYPVAGQAQGQDNIARRPSFNSGDDGAYHGRPASHPATGSNLPPTGEEELFMAGSQAPMGGSQFSPASNALSGYQHRYQDPAPPTHSHSTYNPQQFAPQSNFQRSQSTTLPYRPGPASQYSPNPNSYSPPASAGYATQAYNPAAYATAASPQRQATYHGYPQDSNYGPGIPPQSPYGYGQSPGSTYSATFSQPAPSPALSSGYQQSVPSPDPSSNFARSSMYDQSQYGAGQHPGYNLNGAGSPGLATYSVSNSTPYPTTTNMPLPTHSQDSDQSSYYNRTHQAEPQRSPLHSPLASSHSTSPGLRRHPTNAQLPARPIGQIREDSQWNPNGSQHSYDYYNHHPTADSIMEDLEAELNGENHSGRPYSAPLQSQQRPGQGQGYDAAIHRTTSNATPNQLSYDYAGEDRAPSGNSTVRERRNDEHETAYSYGGPSPGSDARSQPLATPAYDSDSDSDIGDMVDLDALSGGYAGNLTYGNDVGTPDVSSMQHEPQLSPQVGRSASSYGGYDRLSTYDNAEVDYGGTGGLQPPTVHRLSFDDGEERVSVHSHPSGTESPSKDDYQDLFYHPGLTNRPLPALPPGPESDSSSMLSTQNSTRGQYQHSYSLSADSRAYEPEGPEAFYGAASQSSLQPERSVSLSGYSNTPQVLAPARSRTDAAEERKKLTRLQQVPSQPGSVFPEHEPKTPSSSSLTAFDGITLPSGRKKKLVPSKLTAIDFRRCIEPWALSGIEAWIRDMAEGDLDLKEKVVEEALIQLFIFKVPMMNVADAEALSHGVIERMQECQLLVPDEEWVKLGSGHISGVLWQLTGLGCYAPKLHENEIGGRCYSYHCTRTLKRVDLNELLSEASKPADEWYVFYSLKKEDFESKPKKEVERQNILHEIVTGEENYIKQLDIFRTLYRDDLRAKNPPVIHPNRRDKFLTAVFGKLDTVLRINKDHLLAQLKYRQHEQGPWIVGFSDIFREWIRKAKSDYIEYATGYPRAVYMVRKEAERNILFKRFLEDKQKHKSSLKQDWTHFLITPLQRLQRYVLLLESVEQKMLADSEEKANLAKAISEIRVVVLECDEKVEETTKRVEMMELDRMLVLRPGFHSVLNLDHVGRKLLIQGDVQRLGSKGMRWVDTHGLLFDHYMILAKEVSSKEGRADKKYDVSREPIPMPLLFLESMNDEPMIRQKGITAPLGRATPASASGSQLSKVSTNGGGRPGLEHVTTSSSISSVSHLTPTGSNETESKTLYPFKIKHLGHEVYTLYASSARDRLDWCTKIIEAKTRHAKALHLQNAEPFRLRVLADTAFNYDATSIHARSGGVPVKGTPLDRAMEDIESVLGPSQGIPPVCRAQVNCAAGFTAFGKSVVAIGTDYGVFLSDASNPRGWTRTVHATKVTQIAVLEDFSLCLLIADRSLVSYPLDVVAPVSDFAPPASDNPRRAPQRLAKDVTYFATARMKERMLVFYKRREGLHTSFKVLEPILHKATEKKSRVFGSRKPLSGAIESFRDFDEFFFPTECYSLSLFQSYVAVATAKGIEMLTLDKKQPMSIPDLKAPSIANIASRIRDQRPLGMFKLNENEFILTYEDCAVYVDRHGDVSRTLIMEYTGKQKKARGATMYGQYLILFNDDYVEVRNAENGRLRQIIAGRDVRIIDFGIRGPTGTNASQQNGAANGQASSVQDPSKGSVKIAMSHPEQAGKQIVLEMLLNDGHAEN